MSSSKYQDSLSDPTAISGGVDIFEVRGRRLLRQMSSQ